MTSCVAFARWGTRKQTRRQWSGITVISCVVCVKSHEQCSGAIGEAEVRLLCGVHSLALAVRVHAVNDRMMVSVSVSVSLALCSSLSTNDLHLCLCLCPCLVSLPASFSQSTCVFLSVCCTSGVFLYLVLLLSTIPGRNSERLCFGLVPRLSPRPVPISCLHVGRVLEVWQGISLPELIQKSIPNSCQQLLRARWMVFDMQRFIRPPYGRTWKRVGQVESLECAETSYVT